MIILHLESSLDFYYDIDDDTGNIDDNYISSDYSNNTTSKMLTGS